MFDQWCEALMLLSFVFEYQIVGISLMKQWYGNGILFVEVLL